MTSTADTPIASLEVLADEGATTQPTLGTAAGLVVQVVDEAAVTAEAPAVASTPSVGPGVCPVKPEFLRANHVGRVALDADGKTRGMNKGTERQHFASTEGTERPTFEGEMNFLNGDVLKKVKVAIRLGLHPPKRSREWDTSKTPATDAVPSPPATTTATAETAPVEVVGAPPSLAELSTTHQTTPGIGEAAANDEAPNAVAAPSEIRRENAAAESEIYITPPDVLREHAARRDSMFRNKLLLAPLTTVGNLPYRRICAAFGADITLGEMALIYNLNHTQKSEWSLLRRHESEKVFGLQVAVSRPNDAAVFAQAIEASGFSYDYIDINCGCPVDKLVQSGCGCGLWEKKGKLREVVQNLVKYQSKPVTIKCRIGADEHSPTLHNQINEYEGWGASAVTVHGRSRKQRYTKLANWAYIARVAPLTNLPVIGNGDVMSFEDMVERRAAYPVVSSTMIGRGALIKPWVFEEIREEKTMDISSGERFEILKTFVKHGLAHWGADEKGILTTRKFLCEWLSFLCRYVPVGLLERLPQRINERPPQYVGRDDLETLMASDSVTDWIKISEMLLGPSGDKFRFTPKHRSNSYAAGPSAASQLQGDSGAGAEDEG
jgi:tRNA-dihydrouridine synthase 3